jgi:hypothetical protein
MKYELPNVGCVFYPQGAAPPWAAVAIADGFGGSGGCDSVQTGEWGPLYASHGIVSIIVDTGSGDQPTARADALLGAIAALKTENTTATSPLFSKLAGRFGTSGFSAGGCGSADAAQTDNTLLSTVQIMPWGSPATGVSVATLIVCGATDGEAPCSAYGTPAYAAVDSKAPKMRVTVMSGHDGQPSAANGQIGAYALAFQKLFLEGDERWRPLVVAAMSDETTIR